MKLQAVIPFATFAAASLAHATTLDGLNLGPVSGNTNVVPAGSNSIAAGATNDVDDESLAFGDGNLAHNSAFALGIQNDSYWSLVAGMSNVSDMNSFINIVSGYNNSLTYAAYSTVFGDSNVMGHQTTSFALGTSNEMLFPSGKQGDNNVLIGSYNKIDVTGGGTPSNVSQSILIGASNTTTDSSAWALGAGNIGQSGTVTLGTWASTVSNAALIVGTGTSNGARSNGLVVLKNGNASLAGSLTLGGSPAVTTGYLSANNYATTSTRAFGTGASAGSTTVLAFGTNADADGNGSIAIGNSSNTDEAYSVAIGNGANTSETNSVAIGHDAGGFGADSVAIGTGAYAFDDGGIALGFAFASKESTAINTAFTNGRQSFAASYASADGNLGLAMTGGWSSGDASVALGGNDWQYQGQGNMGLGENSAAVGGVRNRAVGFASFASGNWSFANSAYSVALGSLNKAAPGSATNWVETDTLFELGNGYEARGASTPSTGNRSNAITTLKNGNTTLTNKAWKAYVAVNTAPEDALDDPAASTTDSGGEALVVEGHTRLKGKVIIEVPQGDISMGIYE